VGIIDRDSRFTDTVVTAEGRRQIAQGTFRVTHASFSDAGTVYEKADSYDATRGFVLEAGSGPWDTVVVPADEGGILAPFRGSDVAQFGGAAYGPDGAEVGDLEPFHIEALADSSSRAYSRLSLLADYPALGQPGGFGLAPASSSFATNPFSSASLEDAPSLYEDEDLSSLANFDFLPPLGPAGYPLAQYAKPAEKHPALSADKYLDQFKTNQAQTVYLDPAGDEADPLLQVFQASPADGFTRLVTRVYSRDPLVVVVGKLFRDSSGSDTFARLFVLRCDP
jgi:hypothetical protein